jgi:hypothetical protein
MTEANAKNTTAPVVIHKALIALNSDESIYDFTDAIREAARQSLGQKLNLTDKDYLYPVEIFSDKLVVSVSWGQPVDGKYKPTQYFSYTYKRDNAGKFTFDGKTEVKRVTRYEPVMKNKDGAALTVGEMEEVHKGAWEKVPPFWSGASL